MSDPPTPPSAPAIRFGRTEILVLEGNLLAQEVDAIVLPTNCRGALGAVGVHGVTGLRTLAGSEIEREAMAMAPLELGTAVTTGSGQLASRGVQHVIHAVIRRDLGSPARPADIRRAVAASLVAADRARATSVAIGLIGDDRSASGGEADPIHALIAEETVSVLRRSSLRLAEVRIVCRFADQAVAMNTLLQALRNRAWE